MTFPARGVFIIAEAGVNHNGSLDLALRLVDAAAEAGADAVKFQTFKTEKILTRSAPSAAYQERNVGGGKTQFDMIKELELSYADFRRVQDHCGRRGIRFLSTPDEEESLDFLDSIGMDLIKVGSGEVENVPFLRKVGAKRKDVILSTGMSDLGEVERAYHTLLAAGAKSVALLHCTTNYPCPMDEVNLKAMLTLKGAFKTRVGYSDHTDGIEVSLAAVALGARILEKHFTLDKSMPGPDHKASLDLSQLKEMVRCARNVEGCLGDGVKRPAASEREIAPAVKKSIVAKRAVSRGESFGEENLTVKRAGGKGVSAAHWDLVLGRKAQRAYAEDECIEL
ncbi:MAG: N-acetylneuraminate synthase [Fibrobacteres bacterium]|nr:N-acetylneuraminate synthase [Fibrobacterota bacterium]